MPKTPSAPAVQPAKVENMLPKDATWAITAYFDPLGSGKRLGNYREFRRRLQVPLLAVELSFTGRFDLRPDDADILIQLGGGHMLWQKERLLNIALRALPDCCDVVAWLDCDGVFVHEDWAADCRRELETSALVQPFHRIHYLERLDPPKLPERWPPDYLHSFAARYVHGDVKEDTFLTTGASRKSRYVPGMAWVARRRLLETHGFYDAGVIGGGDALLVAAACGRAPDKAAAFHMGPEQSSHYVAWASRFYQDVQGRISFVEGDVVHLWHGDLSDRRYTERFKDFHRFGFDPRHDLAQAPEGVWRWNSNKPELHNWVRGHFEHLDRAWERSTACAND
jgi:hypothetical protein